MRLVGPQVPPFAILRPLGLTFTAVWVCGGSEAHTGVFFVTLGPCVKLNLQPFLTFLFVFFDSETMIG